ncbi:hypothetical protein SNEBB_000294 [Seison nebaliae]|nr:hypothetical protein SNEBB_000294 [Seison nebaliae]
MATGETKEAINNSCVNPKEETDKIPFPDIPPTTTSSIARNYEKSPTFIQISRSEYELLVIDEKTNALYANITYVDFPSKFEKSISYNEDLLSDYLFLSSNKNGKLLCVNLKERKIKWIATLDSPLSHIYVANRNNSINRKTPIYNIKLTTIDEEIFGLFISLNQTLDKWKDLPEVYLQTQEKMELLLHDIMMEDNKKFRLYIGQHGKIFYALSTYIGFNWKNMITNEESSTQIALPLSLPCVVGYHQIGQQNNQFIGYNDKSDEKKKISIPPLIGYDETDRPLMNETSLFNFRIFREFDRMEMLIIINFLGMLSLIIGILLCSYFKSSFSSSTFNDSISSNVGIEEIALGKNSILENNIFVVGRIRFNINNIIGTGCGGTTVFRGEFDGRTVAIKRITSQCCTIANREIDILKQTDFHGSVLRYFFTETDSQFHYIALELCQINLQDYVDIVNYSMNKKDKNLEKKMEQIVNRSKVEKKNLLEIICENTRSTQLLWEITSALEHLHNTNIIHRDIKPHNILISINTKNNRCKIKLSDFGLCKKLVGDHQSFSKTSGISGTDGWMAPELMCEDTPRLDNSIDIFSLGCIYFYVLTNGFHPFGTGIHRQMNIVKNEYNLSLLADYKKNLNLYTIDDATLALDLIKKMIEIKSENRPHIKCLLKHPLFWSVGKRLSFLHDVSNQIENYSTDHPICEVIERQAFDIFENDWISKITHLLQQDLRRHRSYNKSQVRDLLRAMRNKRHHYHELSGEVKKDLGRLPDQFYNYFSSKFPKLLNNIYLSVSYTTMATLTHFGGYFCKEEFHRKTFPLIQSTNVDSQTFLRKFYTSNTKKECSELTNTPNTPTTNNNNNNRQKYLWKKNVEGNNNNNNNILLTPELTPASQKRVRHRRKKVDFWNESKENS